MHFASGKGHITTFEGKICSWSGVGFEGSPREVFWGRYIEPFLEDSTERLIRLVAEESEKNKLNIRLELDTLSNHMRGMYARIYSEMADADQRMLGKGFPEKIDRKDITSEIIIMSHYLDQHIAMTLNKHESRTSYKKKFVESLKEQTIQKTAGYVILGIVVIVGWIWREYVISVYNFLINQLG